MDSRISLTNWIRHITSLLISQERIRLDSRNFLELHSSRFTHRNCLHCLLDERRVEHQPDHHCGFRYFRTHTNSALGGHARMGCLHSGHPGKTTRMAARAWIGVRTYRIDRWSSFGFCYCPRARQVLALRASADWFAYPRGDSGRNGRVSRKQQTNIFISMWVCWIQKEWPRFRHSFFIGQ